MARIGLSALSTLPAFVGVLSLGLMTLPAHAQTSGARSIVIEKDTDYFGFDLATRKKVSLAQCQNACLDMAACRAFTYNAKARYCFLKSDFANAKTFKGAISGRVVVASNEPEIGKAPALTFLPQTWKRSTDKAERTLPLAPADKQAGFTTFLRRAEELARAGKMQESVVEIRQAVALEPKNSRLWRALAVASARHSKMAKRYSVAHRARQAAVHGSVLAYRYSRTASDRAKALAQLARGFELTSWYRPALSAYKQSLAIKENPAEREKYVALLDRHGFRMLSHSLDADLKVPRVCVQFSEKVKKDFADFASYIRVNQQPPKALDVSSEQICVEGLSHGRSYQISLRERLPANNGESLRANVNLDFYMRDRAPSVRFTGNNYVLPASRRHGIPIVSVNSDVAELSLYRVSDRSLTELLRGSKFLKQLSSWQIESLVDSLGSAIWQGKVDLKTSLNKEEVTAIPIDKALPKRKPGVYLMTASPDKHNLKDYPTLATQWFVISDIGLTTFSGAGTGETSGAQLGGLQVLARSLGSAEPLDGVEVSLIARNNDILATTKTDASGLATFDAGFARGSGGLAPAVVTASQGSADFVFLDLTRPGFDLSDRGVTGRPSPEGVDVYAWTERGVYRPGESVHVSALARDSRAHAVSNLPLTFIFERPDGLEFQRLVGSGASLGGYGVSLPLTSNAMRGTWRVKIHADPKKPVLAEKAFLVEDFLPDRTDFTLTPDAASLAVGQSATAKIEGRYLYGAPAAGLTVDGEILIRSVRKRNGFEGYVFGLGEEDEGSDTQRKDMEPAEALDGQGRGTVAFTLDALRATTRPQLAELVVRMREASGRSVERRAKMPIRPADVMIGIRPGFKEGQAAENSDAEFSILAVAPDGSRVAMTGAKWSLVRVERHYQWYREDSRWNYETAEMETKIAGGSLDLTAGQAARLSLPVDWGQYRLTVEAGDGSGGVTSLDFDAGWQVASGSVDSPDGLELALDKAKYKKGDTAILKVSPRFAGKMSLAIGTDQIVKIMSVDVPAAGTEISIPVEEDWGAGAYLLANLFRPADVGGSRNPARAIGVQWLAIDPEERALKVVADAPAQSLPHGQYVVPVRVEGLAAGEEAYVSAALVDVGILNLTRHKSPDPVGRYFGQRALGVDIRDMYGRLIDGSQGAFGTIRTGGDAGGPQLKAQGNKPSQELVAFYSGIVKVDDAGMAEITFDIPQFNGTARLMATAWTKSGVGASEAESVIREPVVIATSLPRVLAPDDESHLLVELTNKDGADGNYKLSVKGNKALSVDTSRLPASIELLKDKKVSLTLPVTALMQGVGEVNLKLTPADSGGESASAAPDAATDAATDAASEEASEASKSATVDISHDIAVAIRSGSLPVTVRRQIALPTKGASVTLSDDLLSGYRLDGAKVSLSVSTGRIYDVPSLLMQLDRYPYGCAEQTTSRALPLLYAKSLAAEMPKELAALSGKAMHARMEKAIAKLISNQNDLGGFSMWGGVADNDPWLTAYVADFLTRAKEQGYKVPKEPLRRALESIRNSLGYNNELSRDSASMAYGLYVLSRNRMASAGDLRYYVDTKLDAFDSPMSQAQLGAALALYGDQVRAEKAFNSALALAEGRAKSGMVNHQESYAFASHRRDVAGMLALAGEVRPALSSINGMRALARKLHDPSRYSNTQEQAWMVLAARNQLEASKDLSLAVNGTAHMGAFTTSIDGADIADTSLHVSNEGSESAVAQITAIATPKQPLPASENGFTLSRSYYRLDGSPVSMANVAQNERFIVVLKGRMLDDVPARIMLSDLLPGGLEVENPKLMSSADSAHYPWLPKSNATHVEFRDDRLLAAFNRNIGGNQDFAVAYMVRAVTPGQYMHPAAVIEDMYRPEKVARTASGWMNVTR